MCANACANHKAYYTLCFREVTEDSYKNLQAQIQEQLAKHTETMASFRIQTSHTQEEQKELEQRVRGSKSLLALLPPMYKQTGGIITCLNC